MEYEVNKYDNMMKSHVINKRVILHKHPEYRDFKGIVISCGHKGDCVIQLDSGKKLDVRYEQIEQPIKHDKYEAENFTKWYNSKCYEWGIKDKLGDVAYPAYRIGQIYRRAKQVLARSEFRNIDEATQQESFNMDDVRDLKELVVMLIEQR